MAYILLLSLLLSLLLLLLVLLENEVTDNLAKTVVKVMQKCRGIQCFSLKKAFIGEDGVKMICRAMAALNRSRSKGSEQADHSGGQQKQHFVSTLRLTSDPLEPSAASPLAALLALPPPGCRLTRLDVSDNLLGDEGCALLAAALRGNPCSSLTALDLSSNLLADEAMEALSDLLRGGRREGRGEEVPGWGDVGEGASEGVSDGGSSLRSLAVSRNTFGDSPVMFLADALKSNHTLQNLE